MMSLSQDLRNFISDVLDDLERGECVAFDTTHPYGVAIYREGSVVEPEENAYVDICDGALYLNWRTGDGEWTSAAMTTVNGRSVQPIIDAA